jgi:hypothetical protein
VEGRNCVLEIIKLKNKKIRKTQGVGRKQFGIIV